MKAIALLACLVLSGSAVAGLFMPRWSIKLRPVAADASTSLHLVDSRPSKDKEFHFVDFLKVSYKGYLGDVNTAPDRMSIFGARLSKIAAAQPGTMNVEVTRFDILQDLSGSACKGCALAAVSPAAAVAVEAGHKPGDDSYTCSITASMDGNVQTAEFSSYFHKGPFDNNNSPASVAALQACLDGAIDRWVEKSIPPTPSNAAQAPEGTHN